MLSAIELQVDILYGVIYNSVLISLMQIPEMRRNASNECNSNVV